MARDRSRILYAAEEREGYTFGRFRLHLMAQGGLPEEVSKLKDKLVAGVPEGSVAAFPPDRNHVRQVPRD